MIWDQIIGFMSSIAPGSATLLGSLITGSVALFAAFLAFKNYVDERNIKKLEKNLSVREKLGDKFSNHELDQVIRFQLNRYSSDQFNKYKNGKWLRYILSLLELIASGILIFAISSFQGGYLSLGFIALFAFLGVFIFDLVISFKSKRGILDKTNYVASFNRGICNNKNYLLEERVLNSGNDREIGYRFIFVYDEDKQKIYAYTKSKETLPQKVRRYSLLVHPHFRSHEIMNVTYEYAWSINADRAYKVTNSYPVVNQKKILKSKLQIDEKKGKLWVGIKVAFASKIYPS